MGAGDKTLTSVWRWISAVLAAVLITNLGWTFATGATLAELCTRDEVASAITAHTSNPHPGAVTRVEFDMLVADLAEVKEDVKWIRERLLRGMPD
ncbi:MAG: hypothetical protein ACE5FA_09575 [Dehalococcoidia bacterium]